MGTTSASGWALFWFLLGFTILGASAVAGGALTFLAGTAVIVWSGLQFSAVRAKEEA